MKYINLGKTGVMVSEYSFGTMTFGQEADRKESEAMVKLCIDKGINFFDTANWYGKGISEEIFGEIIKSYRKEIVISTKVGLPMSEKPNDKGSSRRHIMLEIENSLKRLKTDWIDIYYIHIFDENTSLEESIRALNTLIEQGKILYIGLSNYSAWQIMKAISITELKNLNPISCIQPMYNLLKRQVEVEILPLAKSENLAVMPYNPLAAGMLTGKYLNNDFSSGKRISDNEMYRKRYTKEGYDKICELFIDFCRKHGYKPAPLSIAWVNSHPQVTSTLLGARNIKQLTENLEAENFNITQELRKEISSLSIEPPLATDR